MVERRRVIIITDGDEYARKSIEIVAKQLVEDVFHCHMGIHLC